MNEHFYLGDLQRQLNGRNHFAKLNVDGIPDDVFLTTNDEEIYDDVLAKLTVRPIVLLEEKIYRTEPKDVVVNMHEYPNIGIPEDHDNSVHINATHVDIIIPYTGENWLFQYKPNPCPTRLPEFALSMEKRLITITLLKKHDVKPESFESSYMKKLESIRQVLEYSKKQVDAYNERIRRTINESIKARRKRLAKHEDIKNILNIPLAVNPDAPPIEPIKLKVQHKPSLPNTPKTGLKPEPGIKDEDYEVILQCIRHMGRTFERTPATYAVHGEEQLRDIILAHLNGYFQGDANGEVFRKKGRTDICIESGDRSAFVGECKIWSGPADISAALNQLLGYLTWRDSKAALIVFNKETAGFSGVLDKIPIALNNHHLFIKALPCTEQGEWRVQMRNEEDEGRRVTVHVFAFDLYCQRG